MGKILILGGTQFVGKRLISNLLEKGYDVTVASRGNSAIPHANVIQHVKFDRFDPKTFDEVKKSDWDVIVDQLAFCGYDAKIIVDAFEGRVGRLVCTTSSAVYDGSLDCEEKNFEPLKIDIKSAICDRHIPPRPDTSDYKRGKRAAEIIYAHSGISCSLIRFPKIIGLDDLSMRFYDFYRKIKENETIKISKENKKLSLINSREAARFLSFMIDHSFEGAINANLNGRLGFDYFQRKFDRDISFVIDKDENEESLFKGEEILLNNKLAKNLGFQFEDLDPYLDELISLYDFFQKRY